MHGTPTGTHDIPWVIPIVPVGHVTSWHSVGPRGNSLKISCGVPRNSRGASDGIPWTAHDPRHVQRDDNGDLDYYRNISRPLRSI